MMGEEKTMEMNRELIKLNGRLARANRSQTERCRRYAVAVRLLGEMKRSAVRIEAFRGGDDEFVVSSELFGRINSFLDGLEAAESVAEVVETAVH